MASLPMDSSKEKMTSFPASVSCWILFPIHLKPGSVSCKKQEVTSRSPHCDGNRHLQPSGQFSTSNWKPSARAKACRILEETVVASMKTLWTSPPL